MEAQAKTMTKAKIRREKKEVRKAEARTRGTAHAKYIRISPRKVSIVLDLIRGKDLRLAKATIKHTPKAASEVLIKLLDSATANAINNNNLDENNLFVSECFVTAGPTLKRIRPAAKGSAHRILKRTSHITLTVREKEEN